MNAIALIEGEVSHTVRSLRMNSAASEKLLFLTTNKAGK